MKSNPNHPKEEIRQWIDRNASQFTEISDQIWANPELSYQEFFSSKLQADFLTKQGFRITWGIGGLRTAFCAEWGSGKPILGFAGEYDALANLSQKALPYPEPIQAGAAGHGCGHNLLGVGALAAACALKAWLDQNHMPACIRYYGCPAEETGSGKSFMARAGAFDDLDAAFNFHPFSVNFACKGSIVGYMDLTFRFQGISAHAGATPHLGRSALDAVELMNVGTNYLREHVPPDVRIHYVITKGGDAPNIVPATAEVWYFLRAHLPETMQNLFQRVEKIARGASLMTETEMEVKINGMMANLLNNKTLADIQYANMQWIGSIPFTAEEYAFAEQINRSYPENSVHGIAESFHIPREVLEKSSLAAENYPSFDEGVVYTFSTDVGDLSWRAPLSLLMTACFPTHVAWHTWGVVAAAGTSIGHKGMLHAAKIMALSGFDLITQPQQLEQVRREFEEALHRYTPPPPLPAHIQPPA